MTDDQKVAALYDAIGRGITEWADVEEALFRVFLIALDGADPPSASAAFYAALGFQTKLGMTSAALAVRFSRNPLNLRGVWGMKPHALISDRWKPLYGQLDVASKNRNRLAHYQLILSIKDGVSTAELRPTMFDARNTSTFLDEERAIDASTINTWRVTFQKLGNDLDNLVSEAAALLGQRPIPRGRGMSHIHLDVKTDLITKEP